MTGHHNTPLEPSWRDGLLRSQNGAFKPLLANAMTALREAPEWQSVLAYDEFKGETMILSAPPWDMQIEPWRPRAWTPNDDLLAAERLQREAIPVTVQTVAQAVESVSRERSFHPVRDSLAALQWDGTPRLNTWLADHGGAAPNEYHSAIGRFAMVAAVARIFDPGCKVDTVPIFEGRQGAGKSSLIRTLFDPWFTDELADFGSKDAAMQLRGVWCAEIAELDAMSRMEVSRTKAFISRTTDRFRPPFGSRVIEQPRSSVFWGTTNTDDYLKDETGGRRFWPIRVGKVSLATLQNARDNLWAEAVEFYYSGAEWWISDAMLTKAAMDEQAARYVGDPWDLPVKDYLALNQSVTVQEILKHAIGTPTERHTQADANRIARILKSAGWVRYQVREGGDKRTWHYRQLGTEAPQAKPARNVTTSSPVEFPEPVT